MSIERRAIKPAFRAAAAETADDSVRVKWHDGHESTFHNLWLQDACRCVDCFHPDTLSYSGDSPAHAMSLDPIVSRAVVTDDGSVEIDWGAGDTGHRSRFDAAWLRVHCWADPALEQPRPRTLWGADLELPRFGHAEIMGDDAALLAWSREMRRVGTALIVDTPRHEEGFRALLARVGPLRQRYHPTNVFTLDTGDDVAKKIQHSYQLGDLRNHTDLTAYDIQGGVQFLQCLTYEGEHDPGEATSTIVDGFMISEVMRRDHPRWFDLLTRELIPTGRRRMTVEESLNKGESDSRKYEWEAYRHNHIINLDERGEVFQVRYNHNTRAPLDMDYDTVGEMLAAYREFTRLLEAREYNAKHLLAPGEVMTVDNWRILHGRTGIHSPTLHRVLLGAYLEEETWRSRHRLLVSRTCDMDDVWLMGCSDTALERLSNRFA